MSFSEVSDCLVPSNTLFHILDELSRLDPVFLLIPAQFFEIKIEKILEETSSGVDASKNEHVLPHQSTAMRSSAFDQLFTCHL